LRNWLTVNLGDSFRVLVTIVKATPFVIVTLWFMYMFGMALANDICDCIKEYDGWWRIEKGA